MFFGRIIFWGRSEFTWFSVVFDMVLIVFLMVFHVFSVVLNCCL